jgi:hypothetical protein
MYFDAVFDMAELSKARNALRRKMHPDKLDPKWSQVEKDAATLQYSTMEAEADAKVVQLSSAVPAPKKSTTNALPSTQPSNAPKKAMDPKLKAKRMTQLKAEIQKNYPMIVKTREHATKKTATTMKSRGAYLADKLVSCGADKAAAAAQAYTTEREIELRELKDSDGDMYFEDQTKKDLQQKIILLEMKLESALSELRRKNCVHDNLLTDK